MNWETIVALLSALGGWEAIKYVVTSIVNRKSNKRINEAEADSKEAEADSKEATADGDEFHVLREMIEFLQAQLKEKEERFAEQTSLLRKLNAEIVQVTDNKNDEILKKVEEIGALKLEIQKYKCVVPKCQNRQPQNGY